ncbi:YybH family protein [Azospira restricta]|uniref:Nuclear transport factor 2 family protein n=1 Tax=Azospira restricta TaxID=404405 RepID=A0A974Y5D5_9RHOO|nr:nuclear transport factor 2 family protein [Azospira restricta]QRJ65283.1 nuclear transport factor 2 family protein [Azospira restricta]
MSNTHPPHPTLFASPDDAEAAFYDAIERGDLEAMMATWADDEEVVCIHPSGQRLSGHAAVRESWRQVFESGSRLHVRVSHTVRWTSALMAVHNVLETLYLGDDPTPHGPMLATNVYIRGAKGWRLLAHHASTASEPPSEGNAPPRILH